MGNISCGDSGSTNYLIGGESGVGKTSLAASAVEHPDFSPLLVADLEGGVRSITHRKDVYVDRISSVKELENLAWKLQTKSQDYGDFKALLLDSGSELQSLDLEHTAKAAHEKDPEKREDVDDLQIGDYAQSTTRLRRVFRMLRNLNIHIITTAFLAKQYPPVPPGKDELKAKLKQAELIKAGLIKPMSIKAQFTDKLGASLMGFVDCAWFLFTRERDGKTERFLITKPTGPVHAKTRVNAAYGHLIQTEYVIRLDEVGNPTPSLAALHEALEEARQCR